MSSLEPNEERVIPFVIPPLMKWAFVAVGGATAFAWAVREFRRINQEIEAVKAAPATDVAARHALPTLRRDPATGIWRLP